MKDLGSGCAVEGKLLRVDLGHGETVLLNTERFNYLRIEKSGCELWIGEASLDLTLDQATTIADALTAYAKRQARGG